MDRTRPSRTVSWNAIVVIASFFACASSAHAQVCSSGETYNAVMGGSCWKCDRGLLDKLMPWADTACKTPAYEDLRAATRRGKGTGLLGTDCPRGQAFDLIDGGGCWSCPSGYNRTGNPVNGDEACSKLIPGGATPAKRTAVMVNGPACKGTVRNVAYAEGGNGPVRFHSPIGGNADTPYQYKVSFNCGGPVPFRGESPPLHVPVGFSGFTSRGADGQTYELWQEELDVWEGDGCSFDTEDFIGVDINRGDLENWLLPCLIHDIMWEFVPPDGREAEWKALADEILMINAASVCKQIWPVGSPGLGGCFDGARNMHNWLRNLENSPVFNTNKNFQGNQDKKTYTMSAAEMNGYRDWVKNNKVPDFGTGFSISTLDQGSYRTR